MPSLKQTEIETLKKAFDTGKGPGYVLEFSDRTFKTFMIEEFGLDLEQQQYCVDGTSKGKRLQTFLNKSDGKLGARVLRAIWDQRTSILAEREVQEKPGLQERYFAIVHRFAGTVPQPTSKAEASPSPSGSSPRNTTAEPARTPPAPAAVEALKQSFQSLMALSPQARGFAFERFLGDLFEAFSLAPRGSFRNTGEQIDGSMTFAHDFYLIEAKWQNARTGIGDLLTFSGKVSGKSTWCRGIFFSYTGFSEDGLEAYALGRSTNIICIDGLDLYEIIHRSLDLRDVITAKLRHAAETNRAYVRVAEALR